MIDTGLILIMLHLSPDDGVSDDAEHGGCEFVRRLTLSVVDGHELGDACLGEALEGDLLVGESLGHLVVHGPVHCHRVVHPEHLPVHGLNGGVRANSVSEHLTELLLIHA